MKKNQFSYGIYVLVLVLLCSLLSGCFGNETADLKVQSQESTIQDTTSQDITSQESMDQVVQSSQLQNNASESSCKESQETEEQLQEESGSVKFEVQPGMYLTEILTALVDAGWGESVEYILEQLEQMDRKPFAYWNQIPNAEERAFAAEGYIAPGLYEWKEDATLQEVLTKLLGSWDGLLTAEMQQQAESQGYSVDEILIMASIVEWESSFDPYNVVKPNVAAVVRNRIESETPLQMDVTIFYLQDSLEPYRSPQQYEVYYDTYIRDGLPAGPIGSPSMDSIRAVLAPADTADLFFVYDDVGNYYFAEDYDQHLINCELAGIY